MKLLKQDKDYNCAVYAVDFFLKLNEVNSGIEQIEKELNPSEGEGVSHYKIIDYLKGHVIICGYNSNLIELENNLPAIVNYQYDGDGHYGVVVDIANNRCHIYNPYNGEIDIINNSEFEQTWYSNRYGTGWFLYMINKVNLL